MGYLTLCQTSVGLWTYLAEVLKDHGAAAIGFVILSLLFYKLTWKVWDGAMKAKDAEIERLVKERDKYQAIVFERMLSTKMPTSEVETQKKSEGV